MAENNKVPISGNLTPGIEGNLPADCVAVFVYSTFPSRDTAVAAARVLVEAKVAGCVNIIPAMTSVYVWNGVTEVANEVVLIAKVLPDRLAATTDTLRRHHPYETPALLVLPIVAGNADYLDWLRAGTQRLA